MVLYVRMRFGVLGDDDEEVEKGALDSGMDVFLKKPFSMGAMMVAAMEKLSEEPFTNRVISVE